MKTRKLLCLVLAMLLVSAPALAAKKNAKANKNSKNKYRVVSDCLNTTQGRRRNNGSSCNSGSSCNNGSSCGNGNSCSNGNSCNNGSSCSNGNACNNGSSRPNDGSGSATVTTIAADNISALAGEVIRQTNMERANAGLGTLSVSAALTKAACVRAAEIVEKFSHTRPDGTKWSTVSSQAYGENIAKGHNSADRVMAAWMSSSGHRQNILRASFGSIGVCAYKVNGILYWVQLFGK